MKREPETKYIAFISYGKDSIAMLEAINELNYPLDEIVTVQVWATDNIPGDLPEMYQWKQVANERIKHLYGIDVTTITAKKKDGTILTYDDMFYSSRKSKIADRQIYGFPCIRGAWCNDRLKMKPVKDYLKSLNCHVVQYIGIAADETDRIKKHAGKKKMPLVDIGWTEKDCFQRAVNRNLIAPTYETSMRDGCWFCHNQRINNLKNLYYKYPALFKKLLQWDIDSPVKFKPDGKTVREFQKKFETEKKYKAANDKWRWEYLRQGIQTSIFDIGD